MLPVAEGAADRRLLLLWHPVAVGFVLFVLFGALHVLAEAAGVLLLGFLSVLLAALLARPIELFARWMPRALALLATIALLAGAVTGVALLAAPILSMEAARLVVQVPVALDRLARWWAGLVSAGTIPELPGGGIVGRLAGEAEALVTRAVPFALSAGTVAFTAVLLVVLGLFLAYSPGRYKAALRALVPREHEPLFDEAWARLGTALRHWTGGILLSMTVVGVLTAVGLCIAGIDGWFLLGMLSFLGAFVPYVGAVAAAVPGLMVGLAMSPTRFLYALVVYVIVHLVEGYVASPYIMKRTVELEPGILLFWQLLVGTVFGLPGIVVATPLLACAVVSVDFFYVERKLGKTPARP
jgi:predicted PurR-regulated permease PerM